MKFLLVLASTLVAANAALSKAFVKDFMEQVQQVGKECLAETGATENDFADILAHKIPPSSHEAKCLILCFHKHFELQHPEGYFNVEGFMNNLNILKAEDEDLYEKIRRIFITCASETTQDEDPCITATNLAICAVREGSTIGLKEALFEM